MSLLIQFWQFFSERNKTIYFRIRVWLCDKGEGLDGNGALYELSLGNIKRETILFIRISPLAESLSTLI